MKYIHWNPHCCEIIPQRTAPIPDPKSVEIKYVAFPTPLLSGGHNFIITAFRVDGVSINLQLALDFKYKLSRINRLVEIQTFQQQQLLSAARSKPNHCALILSYTGETREVLEVAEILHTTKTPIISITSMGNNSLAQASDLVLNIVTKEKMYSKIGQFSSRTSILMILDFLYAGIFEKDYEENIKYIDRVNKQIVKKNPKFSPIHEN